MLEIVSMPRVWRDLRQQTSALGWQVLWLSAIVGVVVPAFFGYLLLALTGSGEWQALYGAAIPGYAAIGNLIFLFFAIALLFSVIAGFYHWCLHWTVAGTVDDEIPSWVRRLSLVTSALGVCLQTARPIFGPIPGKLTPHYLHHRMPAPTAASLSGALPLLE